jgi:uncharacterized protein (DUF1778 family)
MLVRDTMITLRLTADEHTMLHAVADHEGLSASDLLRRYIRKSHAKVIKGAASTKPATKGARG